MSAGTVGATGQASFFKLMTRPGTSGDLWLSEEQDNPNYLGNDRPSWEGLYHSTDSGKTWTKIPGIGRAMTFSFGASVGGSPSTLFVFGRTTGDNVDGVHESTDLGQTWTSLSEKGEDLGDSPWEMEGSRQTPGRVFIGTSGRGAFYNVTTP
jgi:xyloglucan-specific exo-beta-1,4-glucanase